jgi:DNA-binding NarL/FixJ family response regulator
MGLINFNFNFGKSNSKIREISNEEFDKIKFKARIAIVDDEEVPAASHLQSDGYNIAKLSDIEEIDSFIRKKYHVVVLDIQGIGKKISEIKEGWGILKYLKEEHPHIVVVVFTGADWSITKYKEYSDLADYVIGKDLEYLDFKIKLDAAIRKSFSPQFHFEIAKRKISKEIADADTILKIENIVKKHGLNSDKAISKVKKITPNQFAVQNVSNYLSIISSIFNLVSTV